MDDILSSTRAGVLALACCGAIAQEASLPSRQQLDAQGHRPLTTLELQALLPGNTLYHVVPKNGFRVPLLYLPNGTRVVRIRGEEIRSTWRIERDMVCEHSVVLKRQVCRSLYRGAVNAVCDEGSTSCDYGLDWAEGNPERLTP